MKTMCSTLLLVTRIITEPKMLFWLARRAIGELYKLLFSQCDTKIARKACQFIVTIRNAVLACLL